MRIGLLFASLVFVTACDAPPPQLEARLSAEARNTDFPPLIPLRPMLVQTDDLLPDDPVATARNIEARAADLRRRAALLRALPVN